MPFNGESSYKKKIKEHIRFLNAYSDPKFISPQLNPDFHSTAIKDGKKSLKEIFISRQLEVIKALNEEFFEKNGMEIKGQILCSRHGESRAWDEKHFGFYPNAGLSDRAKINMKDTNLHTSALLYFPPEKTYVAVSPLIRAKETAHCVIPKYVDKDGVLVEWALTENSLSPSGIGATSYGELVEAYDKLSWRSPTFKILMFKLIFKLTLWVCYLFPILELIAGNDENINQRLNLERDVFKFIEKTEKIKHTRTLIQEQLDKSQEQGKDIWLFGHGNNFKALFKDWFNNEDTFEFGETRPIYYVQKEDGSYDYICPPYVLVIDQTTGLIRAKYTDKISPQQTKALSNEKNAGDSEKNELQLGNYNGLLEQISGIDDDSSMSDDLNHSSEHSSSVYS